MHQNRRCMYTNDAFCGDKCDWFSLDTPRPSSQERSVQGNESLEYDGPTHVNVCGVAICYKQKKASSDQKLNRLNFRPRIWQMDPRIMSLKCVEKTRLKSTSSTSIRNFALKLLVCWEGFCKRSNGSERFNLHMRFADMAQLKHMCGYHHILLGCKDIQKGQL